MAKMFYSIEEAAECLGVTQDQLKQMAASGKLQQFRDRDKLMFKRDQVDALAQKGGTSGGSKAPGASGGPIALAPSGETDAIDLKADSHRGAERKDDPRQATGISVFDAGEVTPADPMAQTQVTPSVRDEDLAIESVGSGSGLLDLTRESDDTSLGAELLDEIYPGSGGEPSDVKVDTAMGSGVSAVADAGSASGLEEISSQASPAMIAMAGEAYDPAGSGLSVGMLIGATITLFILLIVAVFAINGAPSAIASTMAANDTNLLMYSGILLGGSIVLGVIGMFIAKATAK
jgi:excisionase family DNA binding protein